MSRIRLIALLLLITICVPAGVAGLYEDIYRGLELFTTPSGSPTLTASDGTRVNGNRSGRLRIVPNAVGDGYSLELNRTFGADSQGRSELLDLGMYELELAGSTSMTLGYTSRGMLIGNADVTASNLNYALRAKSGAQDITLQGILNVGGSMEVNQLGFYTLDLQVSNATSQLLEDGVVVDGNTPTNFDIGPITVKGNIYVDLFVGVLQTLGLDTSALDPLVAESGIGALTDAIREDVLKVAPTLLAAESITSDGQLPAVAPASETPLADLTDTSDSAHSTADSSTGAGVTPEPAALLLAAFGTAFLLRRPRR